jgi:hypothetical protein
VKSVAELRLPFTTFLTDSTEDSDSSEQRCIAGGAGMFQIHPMEMFIALLVLVINALPIVLSTWVLITVKRMEKRFESKFSEIQELLQNKN